MRISCQWLQEFVSFPDEQTDELAEQLTLQGVSVEEIERPGEQIQGVVCGRILTVERHPNADKLSICQVDVGRSEPLQIVTGAANVRPEQWTAVAMPGARLPGGLRIKPTKLRGVRSEGMLCSARELALPYETEEDGILDLHIESEEFAPGTDIRRCLGLDDTIFVLELTPNYAAHCQSVYGVAVETAALLEQTVQLPEIVLNEASDRSTADVIDIRLDDAVGCPRYVGRIITGVKVGPSPAWLQRRLRAAGMRPVNNVVDVTNYVMLEFGQPLHAFDLDTLSGRQIIVRRAEDGEEIVTIDGRTRVLKKQDLVIADGNGPIAIAGVMGGKPTEVSEQTVNIFLESATFDPMTISHTSRRLGLRTEASMRYEKGSDWELCHRVADRAAALIGELAGGVVLAGRVDVYPHRAEPRRINVSLERINRILGTELSYSDVQQLLARLSIRTEREDDESDLFRAIVPTRRVDLIGEADIAEEVGRMYGYNRIPTAYPKGEVKPVADRRRKLREALRDYWQQSGFHEAINLPFTSTADVESWQWAGDDRRRMQIALANPLSQEQGFVRTSLLPNLLRCLAGNIRRGQKDVALFELSRVYMAKQWPMTELPEEPLRLALAVTGDWSPAGWYGQAETVDFYTVKGLLLDCLQAFGLQAEVVPARQPGFHPGRTAQVLVQGEGQSHVVGIFGELHPLLLDDYGLDQRVLMADLDVETILDHSLDVPRYQPLPRHPAVQRDLSFVVSEDVSIDAITHVIREAAGNVLEDVRLFDVYYDDAQIGKDRRSLAFHLVYRAVDRTLRDDEVDQLQQKVRQQIEQKFKAVLRS